MNRHYTRATRQRALRSVTTQPRKGTRQRSAHSITRRLACAAATSLRRKDDAVGAMLPGDGPPAAWRSMLAAARGGLRARWPSQPESQSWPDGAAYGAQGALRHAAQGAQGAAVDRRQPRVEIRARIISTDDGTTEISSMPMRTSSWVKPSSAASSPHTPTQMPCLWALLTVISIRRITAR